MPNKGLSLFLNVSLITEMLGQTALIQKTPTLGMKISSIPTKNMTMQMNTSRRKEIILRGMQGKEQQEDIETATEALAKRCISMNNVTLAISSTLVQVPVKRLTGMLSGCRSPVWPSTMAVRLLQSKQCNINTALNQRLEKPKPF